MVTVTHSNISNKIFDKVIHIEDGILKNQTEILNSILL